MTRKSVAGDKLMSSGKRGWKLGCTKSSCCDGCVFFGAKHVFRVENRAHWRCVVVA